MSRQTHQKVILLEDHPHLGKLGDLVLVRHGHARNYLLPQGKADRATPESIKRFELLREERERQQAEKLKQAVALGEKISSLGSVLLVRKAGMDGRLFGSVGSADIAKELGDRGISVDKRIVRVPESILKSIGEFTISVEVHHSVKVDLTVYIKPESLHQ